MEMIEMYEKVFKDCVECYFDNIDIELSEEQKDYIVDKLIYKSEYMWEVIDETIENLYQSIKEED